MDAKPKITDTLAEAIWRSESSIADIARGAGVSEDTVRRLRDGQSDPRESSMARVAAFFGLELTAEKISKKL